MEGWRLLAKIREADRPLLEVEGEYSRCISSGGGGEEGGDLFGIDRNIVEEVCRMDCRDMDDEFLLAEELEFVAGCE